MMDCPNCDFDSDEYNTLFEHRVKNHTSAGDGESFNLYDEEVYTVYVDLALHKAQDNLDEDAEMIDMKYELRELGLPVQLSDEEFEEFFERGEL